MKRNGYFSNCANCELQWRNTSDFVPIKYNFSHTASTLSINFYTNLNEAATNEDLAIREVRIYLDMCHPSCATCTSPAACSSCTGNSFMYQGSCVSACPSGTYGYSGKCESCPKYCLVCASVTQCITCKVNYYFLNGQCLTACPYYTTAVIDI